MFPHRSLRDAPKENLGPVGPPYFATSSATTGCGNEMESDGRGVTPKYDLMSEIQTVVCVRLCLGIIWKYHEKGYIRRNVGGCGVMSENKQCYERKATGK